MMGQRARSAFGSCLVACLVSLGLSGLVSSTAHAGALWSVDKTFGRKGTASTPFSADGLAVDRKGRVIITGSAGSKYDATAVARRNPAGKPDRNFGYRGEAYFGGGNTNTYGEAVGIDSEGRILIAGYGTDYDGFRIGPELYRLNRDGSRDRSFKNHRAYPYFSGVGFSDVEPLDNGKILVAGGGEGTGTKGHPTILLRRFKASGKPDKRFGNRSRVVIKGPRYSEDVGTTGATSLHVLPSGKFLVSGVFADRPWVGRFHANGRIDHSFGRNGSVTMKIKQEGGCGVNGSCAPSGLAVVKDGAIRMLANKVRKDGRHSTAYVVGFTHDGSVDQRFGRNGRVKVLPKKFLLGGAELIKLAGNSLLVSSGVFGNFGYVAKVSPNGRRVDNFDHLGGNYTWVIGEANKRAIYLATGGSSSLLRKYRRR